MRTIIKCGALIIVLSALMVIPATVFGDIGLPVITETEVVYDDTNMIMVKINVFGHNFGATVGTVKLGDTQLQVENWSPQEIVATLPQGIGPGSYLLLLTVTVPTKLIPLIAALGVTLGAEGPQGKPGPAGPQGAQGPAGPQGEIGPDRSSGADRSYWCDGSYRTSRTPRTSRTSRNILFPVSLGRNMSTGNKRHHSANNDI